jgi:hypothetical protein
VPSSGAEDVEQPVGQIFWCVSFEEGDADDNDGEHEEPGGEKNNEQSGTQDID